MRSLLFTALVSFAAGAAAQSPEIYSDRAGAIRGYDPVAYLFEGRPVKGSADFTHQWKGASWRFASAANRDRFAAAPEKFAPQYGGYCAYAVANNATASIDAQAWNVVDEKDIPGHIRTADANWPHVLLR